MMRLILATVVFALFSGFAPAQDSLKTIDQLQFMEGTWKGEGWIMKGRERKEFVQTEVIESRVENTILVIDGIGYDKSTLATEKKIIHNAFGVISYNEDRNAMTMLSFSSAGNRMENQIRSIGDKKLEWSFESEQGGTVRFREDYSQKGKWVEVGEYSMDGENWSQFFEMTLERVENP